MAMRQKTEYNCNWKYPFHEKETYWFSALLARPTISEVSVGKGKRKL